MMCPHCLVAFHHNADLTLLGKDRDGDWIAVTQVCPSCGRMIVTLACGEATFAMGHGGLRELSGMKDVTRA